LCQKEKLLCLTPVEKKKRGFKRKCGGGEYKNVQTESSPVWSRKWCAQGSVEKKRVFVDWHGGPHCGKRGEGGVGFTV